MKKKLNKILLFLIVFISINLIFLIFQNTKAATNIYVPLNGTYTFTESSSQYTIGDSSIASVSVGSQYNYTAANLGTNSSYNGEEVSLDSCLFQFDLNSGTRYYVHNNSVYLRVGRILSSGNYTYYANSDTRGTVTTSISSGNITFTSSSIYLYFDSNKFISSAYGSANKSTFNLYRKVQSGETSSTEIPGFVKVTSITSGTKYLIVRKDGNDYYLLYPSSSIATQYSQTAKIGNKSGVEYTITGNSIGTTTLTINGEDYLIRVYDENTILDPDSNFTDKALTIGMGTTYKIKTNASNIVWSSNDTSIATVSSDGTVTPVSQGETTLIANLNGAKYSIRVRVIDGSSSGALINILIDSDEDTIPYYNPNMGSTFYELVNGERIYGYLDTTSYASADFWGAPKSGYALSYMTVGSAYSPITGDTTADIQNGTSTAFLASRANNFSVSQTVNTVNNAIQNNIEGITGYSRGAGNTVACTATIPFRSERLSAEISQEVYSINGNSYQSGDEAGPGDIVIFKVTVSKTSTDEHLIVYEGTLTNSLTGAVFLGTNPTDNGTATTQSVTLSSTNATQQTYYIKYTVPNQAPNNISNTVSYEYSTYADEALDTASYKIERGTLADTTTVGANGAQVGTTITITKNVSGNMRETDKYFKFLVTIHGTNGDQYTIAGQDSVVTYNGVSVNTSSTYTVGSTNYVYLKDGQTITIGLDNNGQTYQIPIGITYSVTEQDAEEYSTRITGIQGTTKTTGNLTSIDGTNLVEFTNTRDRAALTGQFFENGIFMVVLLISSLILLLQLIKYLRIKNK